MENDSLEKKKVKFSRRSGLRKSSLILLHQTRRNGFVTLEPFATCRRIGTRAACIQKKTTWLIHLPIILLLILLPIYPFPIYKCIHIQAGITVHNLTELATVFVKKCLDFSELPYIGTVKS